MKVMLVFVVFAIDYHYLSGYTMGKEKQEAMVMELPRT